MGKPSDLRQHANAIRAANMKVEGYTTRQIAALIEKEPGQIKQLILLGQRLISERNTTPKEAP